MRLREEKSSLLQQENELQNNPFLLPPHNWTRQDSTHAGFVSVETRPCLSPSGICSTRLGGNCCPPKLPPREAKQVLIHVSQCFSPCTDEQSTQEGLSLSGGKEEQQVFKLVLVWCSNLLPLWNPYWPPLQMMSINPGPLERHRHKVVGILSVHIDFTW